MHENPQTLRSETFVRVFDFLLAQRLRRNFHAVRISRPRPALIESHYADADTARRPLIIYCNHPSWWDAALMPVLARRLFPHRQAFAPIDADALERYRFMRRLGFFGVQADCYRGAATFLRVSRQVLARPDAVLGLTPEGRFTDPRERPIRLRTGLATLISRVPSVNVIPIALEYPFWAESTPEALVRVGETMTMGRWHREEPLACVHERLEGALSETMDALAIDARARDATRFTTLLDGRAGVGGIYDGWRRMRARIKGEPFDPAHGAVVSNQKPSGRNAQTMTLPRSSDATGPGCPVVPIRRPHERRT